MRMRSLRRLRWQLALLVVVYFFAGAASQKLLPGIDEIIPLYGWSLFSKVPNEDSRYVLLILRQRKRTFQPPVSFLNAPETLVTGNRYIGRKVIQRLGRAIERGEADKIKDLPGTVLESWMAESCTGSYPLSVVASSHAAANAAPSAGQFLVLTVELTLDGVPWLGTAPLIVGQKAL